MKVLILSQWCYPEPDLKALTFAEKLRSKGHAVQILTGFPNYPGGKVYPGYNIKLFAREEINGIEILRCALYPSHDKSSVKRILNYLSFAFFAALIGIFKVRKADVMYVYHPPATVAMAAIMIKLFRRIPMVYDIQDMWPDTLKATGMLNSRFLLKMIDMYMKVVYRMADHITVLSNGFRELLIGRGVPAAKISVVYNWSNPIHIPLTVNAEEKRKLFGDDFTIMFAGTVGLVQGLDILIRCAELLRSQQVEGVRFAILGGGIDVDRLKRVAQEKDLQNIMFLPRVSNDKVGDFLVLSDVLLIHLVDDALFRITVPSKTQAYLLAGKPILVGVKGDAAKIVEEAGAGYAFEPENEVDLLEKIKLLKTLQMTELSALGQQGAAYYEENLSIEKGVVRFEQLFQQVAGVH